MGSPAPPCVGCTLWGPSRRFPEGLRKVGGRDEQSPPQRQLGPGAGGEGVGVSVSCGQSFSLGRRHVLGMGAGDGCTVMSA